jgi:NAD+ synthase
MAEGMTSDSLLRIDETRALEGLIDYIRKSLDLRRAEGILLGLSGGIDSCLLAAVAEQAVGKRSVHAAYLYDRTSSPRLRRNARLMSSRLGIGLAESSIDPAMRRMGVYSSSEVKITSVSGPLNRLFQKAYCLIHGESPFISSLRRGSAAASKGNDRSKDLRRGAASPIETGFNSRHIYRRRLLEAKARSKKLLLLGAANRTEWLTGWFVKGGVDDLPDEPLLGLYKTQIRQLAACLRMPDDILTAKPSPDMMEGITDEFALGASYGHIDLALDFMEGGTAKKDIMEAGVKEAEIRLVEKIVDLSAWKRNPPHHPPPVDGGPFGGFRLNRPHEPSNTATG